MLILFIHRPVPIKTEEDEDEDEEEDFTQGDDAASSWLQSMGLDKQEFPTLDPRRVKLYPFLCYDDFNK